MSEPIQLRVVPASPPEASAAVLERLSEATLLAADGDITGIALVMIDRDGEIVTAWSDVSLTDLLAGAARLAHEVNQMLDDE